MSQRLWRKGKLKTHTTLSRRSGAYECRGAVGGLQPLGPVASAGHLGRRADEVSPVSNQLPCRQNVMEA